MEEKKFLISENALKVLLESLQEAQGGTTLSLLESFVQQNIKEYTEPVKETAETSK